MSLSHKKLSGWYLQISQSLDAGLPLTEALDLAKGPPAQDVARIVSELKAGKSVDDVLAQAPKWLGKADRFLLSAAQTSGRMPEALRNLSERHKESGENIAKAIIATLYPLGILHLGIFLFPILNLVEFTENAGMQFHFEKYASSVLIFLVPLWCVIGVLGVLSAKQSPIIRGLMMILPGLRGYRKSKALADFAFALESFLRAGAPMDESWFAAGSVAGDPKLEKAALSMTETIKLGKAPGDHLVAHGVFPSDFIALYKTGEQTGQLDANLAHLHHQYRGKATKSLALSSFWYPKLLFLILAFYAAYKAIEFYSNYLGGILEMLE